MHDQSGAGPAARTVEDHLDQAPIGRFHLRVFVLAFSVVFMDGFDNQAISYLAPLIARDWSLARGAMGTVFSAGLFGLMLGALFIAPLADRWGRRRLILGGTLAFAALSLSTILVKDLTTLALVRFVTGVALGTALTNAIALASDYSPARRRGLVTMITTSGISLGSIASGLLTASIGVRFGWQMIFVVGGVVPLMLWFVLLWKLPESVQFAERAGSAGSDARRLIGQLSGEEPNLLAPSAGPARQSVAGLFQPPLRWLTPLLWLALTGSMLTAYLIVNWLPSILTGIGFPVAQAATLATLYHLGGVFGTYMLGLFIVDRLGGRGTVLVAIGVAIAGLATYAAVAHYAGFGLAAITLAVAGFGIVSTQIALVTLAATSYPTRLRATGLGWALGISRTGSIAGPVIGGAMIAAAASVQSMLLFCAAVFVVVAGAAIAMGKPRSPAGAGPVTA